mmetsp:Transcript_22010/g.28105  ORF Transcript_22010/g.28105 Transcript_22010/m.28105 type:complete len:192 (+) Transcript_22010:53-628(+)
MTGLIILLMQLPLALHPTQTKSEEVPEYEPDAVDAVPFVSNYLAGVQRLQDHVKMYGMAEHQIKGDGACQFASISDQLYQAESQKDHLRSLAIKQLLRHPEYYVEFVEEENYVEYCKKMSLHNTWGDHITLQALSDCLGIVINLITSYTHQPHIEIIPNNPNTAIKNHIWLSFHGEVHYNSLYPEDLIHLR